MITRPLTLALLQIASAGLLLVAGVGKLLIIGSGNAFWAKIDPVLLIERQWLYPAVGMLEITLGIWLIVSSNRLVSFVVPAVCATSFVAYRAALYAVAKTFSCDCFGTIWSSLHHSLMTEIAGWAGISVLVATALVAVRQHRVGPSPQQRNENRQLISV